MGIELVERARAYLKEDKLLEAAWALDELATNLGDDGLIERTTLALGRTRRIEREALDGLVTREEMRVERNRIVLALSALAGDLAREVERREAARSRAETAEQQRIVTAVTTAEERSADVMVSCRGVVKRYGARFTLGPVSFTLGHGEILGVVGANGSGKSSLLRLVAGELAPNEGKCELSPLDAARRPRAVRAMLVPESPPSWSGSLEEHLSWQAAIFGYNEPKESARQVAHVLKQLDIMAERRKGWGQLSDGMRMRAAIAAAVLARPFAPKR